MKLVIGISGASGAPYARRLLQCLRTMGEAGPEQVAVVTSRTAEQVWSHECEGHPRDFDFPVYGRDDFSAPFASGSAGWQAMVVMPASMGCLGRMAHGISDDLLTRAADVMLKERRKLVVVPRETPYSEIHLQNMLTLSRAGAVVVPASPSFYGRPESVDALLDTVVSRVLDQLGIRNDMQPRWGSDVTLASDRLKS